MGVESPRASRAPQKNSQFIERSGPQWVAFNTKNGAPLTLAFPLMHTAILSDLQQDEIITPVSKWELRRQINPSYSGTGSGFEGYLCAFQQGQIANILEALENEAFASMRNEAGIAAISSFLNDPSGPVGIQFVASGRRAFDTAFARVKATQGMIESKKGYYYKDGECVSIDPLRKDRSKVYAEYISNFSPVPPIIDLELSPETTDTLVLIQKTKDRIRGISPPIPREPLGGNIKNDKYILLAELGRFGHPMIPILLNNCL